MKTIITKKLESQKITVTEDLTFIAILKKGWNSTHKLNFKLEQNAHLTFLAFIIGKDKNKFKFETTATHGPNSKAYFATRAALFDSSSLDYKGNLIIPKKAQKTDTFLANHTLLLSKSAKVKTTPSLEIQANDIKAGHAATMDHKDENIMLYAQSRGLDKRTATDILVKGFLSKELKKITDPKTREKVLSNL